MGAKTANATSFKPGESGNPAGRPLSVVPAEKTLKALARVHTEECVERLLFWIRSNKTAASVKAAEILLDRGWFKPRDDSASPTDSTAPTIDAPPKETYEEWMARREREIEKLRQEIKESK